MARRISSRLLGGYIAIILLLAVASAAAILAASEMRANIKDVVNSNDALVGVVTLRLKLADDEETGLRGYLLTRDRTFLQPYTHALKQLPALRTTSLRLAGSDSQLHGRLMDLTRAALAWERWARITLHRPVGNPTRPEFIASQVEGKRLFDRYRRVSSGVISALNADRRVDLHRSDQTARDLTITLAAVFLAAILLTAVIGWRTIRAILQPLQALRTAASTIGSGDLETPVVIRSAEEFEALGTSMDTMRRRLTEQRQEVNSLNATLEARVVERTRQLEETSAELSAILAQMAEGVMIVNGAGTVVFVNDAGRALLGGEPNGAPLDVRLSGYSLEALSGAELPPDMAPILRAFRDGESIRDERLRIRRPDGVELIAQVSAVRVVAHDGAMLGAVATYRDITAQYELERQKDDFLSIIAHDLKTPVATIKGLAQYLLRRGEGMPAEQLAQLLVRVDTNTTRMTALINQLLDVTTMQMGRPLDLHYRRIDLVALVREIALDQAQRSSRHSISVEPDAESLTGWWDAFRLERVFVNLIANAVKFSPDAGHITIRVASEECDGSPCAAVRVTDSGIGIPPADLPHVFERFFRAGNAVDRIAGTGIGLSGVRQIVEQHGGSITVQSALGEGSTFTVHLPLEPVDGDVEYAREAADS